MSNEPLNLSSQPPVILAIETATRAGSVAVARGEQILSSRSGDAASSHSTDLIENLDAILQEAAIRLADVDLFAAAVGPGSFTGLRIGLATAKSLAVSMNRQCVGVSTLAAIASSSCQSERIVTLLPAGRGEVFAQMFTTKAEEVSPLDEPAHLSPTALLAKYSGYDQLTWAGEGALTQLELLRREAESRSINFAIDQKKNTDGWRVESPPPQLAEALAKLALSESRAGRAIDPENLRANYVRPSDAEIKTNA